MQLEHPDYGSETAWQTPERNVTFRAPVFNTSPNSAVLGTPV